jgi:hypothetical protein
LREIIGSSQQPAASSQQPAAQSDSRSNDGASIAASIPNNQTKSECLKCKSYPGTKIALEILTLGFAIVSAVAAGFAVHYYNRGSGKHG